MSGINQPTHMVFDSSEGDPVAFVYGDYPSIQGLPSFITLSGYLENCSITGCPIIQRQSRGAPLSKVERRSATLSFPPVRFQPKSTCPALRKPAARRRMLTREIGVGGKRCTFSNLSWSSIRITIPGG